MKLIMAVVLAMLAVAHAAVVEPPAKILSSSYTQTAGGYNAGFETDNGISRNEEGELKSVVDEDNKPINVLGVRGQWTYTDPDGKVETVSYYADETGFHAMGDSIPKQR